ncbi:MAG TPA: class I SAM-dependent methyltransferase [Verrucomicrobiae bacterium]|nr:class I SAM-dependent methyltransferase [Verrucomicrobiae bacterium]
MSAALDRIAPGKLLDVGCGSRPFQRASFQWVGLDVEGNPHADVVGTALALPFEDASFDAVLSTQVIEHVEDPAAMLRECARVLRDGGTMVLSGPQYFELHEEPRDFYRFTEYGLRLLCSQAGFEVAQVWREGCGLSLAGIAINSAILQIGGRPSSLLWKALKAPFFLLVNLCCYALGRVVRNDRDVQNYTMLAIRRPR